MADKKYQVFISSTYSDLVEERRKVLDILLSADCIPSGMEAFVATDAEQFEVIKKVIDLCDYYVLIIGQRYGSVNPKTGQSYTEMEYDYAKSKKIPVLVFAIDETIELPEEKRETEATKIKSLLEFRKKAMMNRLASIWKTADELIGKLAVAIMKAKNEIIRPGWQRATDYDEASLLRKIMELEEKNTAIEKKLNDSQQTIRSLTEETNLEYENCNIKIEYHYYIRGKGMTSSTKHYGNKTVPLPEIFRVISTEMMGVSITENRIEKAIVHQIIPSSTSIYFDDEQLIKKILNQLEALKLLDSIWSEKNSEVYWRLTTKGIKVRDNMILFRKKDVSRATE